MHILGINASAREKGNCRILLEEALKAAKGKGSSTEIVCLDKMSIAPWKEKQPKDDMDVLEQKIIKADAIILASPVYFGSLSAQAKIMIDRCQGFWEIQNIKKQSIRSKKIKGAFICVQAADRDDFFQNAKQITKNFFAVIEAEYYGELLLKNIEQKQDVFRYPQYIKQAYALGSGILK